MEEYTLTVFTDKKISFTVGNIEAVNIKDAIFLAKEEMNASFNPGKIEYRVEDNNSKMFFEGTHTVKEEED